MTQQGTKIFGFRIPLDPKIFVGILFAIGLLLAWHNFSGGSDDHPSSVARPAATVASSATPPSPSSLSQNIARRADLANRSKQGVLHFKPVDPTHGDIDPTLKLWLLERVRSVKPLEGGRNLFETGPELAQAGALPLPKVKSMLPKPLEPVGPMSSAAMAPPPVNIPLRYYGFVKPSWRGDGNRGYFMEGENILMATEGDVLEGHFLVVALSPNKARVEDIQLKQGQDLPLIPEAVAQ
jgi:hypothetical protein